MVHKLSNRPILKEEFILGQNRFNTWQPKQERGIVHICIICAAPRAQLFAAVQRQHDKISEYREMVGPSSQ